MLYLILYFGRMKLRVLKVLQPPTTLHEVQHLQTDCGKESAGKKDIATHQKY